MSDAISDIVIVQFAMYIKTLYTLNLKFDT